MKKYYAFFPRNFANEYSLYSVEDKEDQEAIDKLYNSYDPTHSRLCHVTVKEMRKWTSEEKWNMKHDASFSGYCDLEPIPAKHMNDLYW